MMDIGKNGHSTRPAISPLRRLFTVQAFLGIATHFETRGSVVVEALSYKPQGSGFDSRRGD
jgi:hypothetical protein